LEETRVSSNGPSISVKKRKEKPKPKSTRSEIQLFTSKLVCCAPTYLNLAIAVSLAALAETIISDLDMYHLQKERIY